MSQDAPSVDTPDEIPQSADPSVPAPPPPFDYSGPGGTRMWLVRNEQWLIYCLPFLVFMIFGVFEPSGPVKGVHPVKPWLIDADIMPYIDYQMYPYLYSLKIGMTCLAIVLVWPGYWQFPWKINHIAWIVGVVGAVLWVAISKGQQLIDPTFLKDWGLGSLTKLGLRSGFNPLVEIQENPALAWSFLAIRFFGLVLVVPLIEEMFLRGFLMRYVVHVDWWVVPFGTRTLLAAAVGVGVPMMMHPQELFAAAVWFSMITWMTFRTRNIWDCVVAHAVTNLLMGVWVLYSGDWFLM